MNLSIRQSTSPNCGKMGLVTPVFQTGHQTNVVNYRQISILSVMSKRVEKVVSDQIVNFIDIQN